jgi:hypothetical protein
MARGFSIRIFLPDGSPDGLRLVEKSNWTGQGIVCPRTLFPTAEDRGEPPRKGGIHPAQSRASRPRGSRRTMALAVAPRKVAAGLADLSSRPDRPGGLTFVRLPRPFPRPVFRACGISSNVAARNIGSRGRDRGRLTHVSPKGETRGRVRGNSATYLDPAQGETRAWQLRDLPHPSPRSPPRLDGSLPLKSRYRGN